MQNVKESGTRAAIIYSAKQI